MKQIHILHTYFIDPKTKDFVLGGIETYLRQLYFLLKDEGYNPIIYQFSDIDFSLNIEGIKIIGVDVSGKKKLKNKIKMLVNRAKSLGSLEKDIFIFSTHSMSVKDNSIYSIGIQHGITFDIIDYNEKRKAIMLKDSFSRFLKGINTINHVKKFDKIIAVDYNFLNWYRTVPFYKNIDIKVIPNFVEIENDTECSSNTDDVKIIFARRLQKYRGTELLSEAIDFITQKYDNVYFTIAGEGPEEKKLRSKHKNNKFVKFIRYESKESWKIHSNHDISIVPTIGSEGTSLSLLEAMATKNAVIASNVGGMTNIIIDNYNGLIIEPKLNSLIEALEILIQNKNKRLTLSEKGYETVIFGFNYENWAKKWLEIVN